MENALYKYLFIITIIIILSLPCVNNSEDANRVRAKWNSE